MDNMNSPNYRMIRMSSDGAISFFPPTTFHNCYFDCLPDEHAANWHVKVRAVVKTELNNLRAAEEGGGPPAVLVSYDDPPPNQPPETYTYTAYYIQHMPLGLDTPLPTNLRLPGPPPQS